MILSINTGSTSIKYALFSDKFQEIFRDELIDTHPKQMLFKKVAARVRKHFDNKKDCLRIAHRVVHGGERYQDCVFITDEVISAIKGLIPLAPLHNPYNLKGILYARKYFKNC